LLLPSHHWLLVLVSFTLAGTQYPDINDEILLQHTSIQYILKEK